MENNSLEPKEKVAFLYRKPVPIPTRWQQHRRDLATHRSDPEHFQIRIRVTAKKVIFDSKEHDINLDRPAAKELHAQ